MVTDPEPVLFALFKFLLDVDSIEGTVIEKRIRQIAAQGYKSKAVYALKDTEGKMMDKHV